MANTSAPVRNKHTKISPEAENVLIFLCFHVLVSGNKVFPHHNNNNHYYYYECTCLYEPHGLQLYNIAREQNEMFCQELHVVFGPRCHIQGKCYATAHTPWYHADQFVAPVSFIFSAEDIK